MKTEYFVRENSIVRKIWGKSDTILFIFAGASAEFALNKAVDWLYFTGKLPQDPLGRLFSTVSYARSIVFADEKTAHQTIDRMAEIHSSVEMKRGKNIPDWAYRDVLFMLIDYSIRSYEILEQKLNKAEKSEVYDVFKRMGARMGLKDLPSGYDSFVTMRKLHMEQHLYYGEYTGDLFKRYRSHLGFTRYRLLIETQTLIVPKRVGTLLNFRSFSLLYPLIGLYKISRKIRLDELMKAIILPPEYKTEIRSLDYQSTKDKIKLLTHELSNQTECVSSKLN